MINVLPTLLITSGLTSRCYSMCYYVSLTEYTTKKYEFQYFKINIEPTSNGEKLLKIINIFNKRNFTSPSIFPILPQCILNLDSICWDNIIYLQST